MPVSKIAICPACDVAAVVPRCPRCEAWVVRIPPPAKVMTSNQRPNHWVRAQLTKEWRTAAGWTFRSLNIPRLERVHIWVHWNAVDGRQRDPANCYPTVKACIDGITDAGVIPDDDAAHVIGPDMRLGQPCRPSTLTIALAPLEPTP
jgi:crossover junction endodeoxyribonuclease RusA